MTFGGVDEIVPAFTTLAGFSNRQAIAVHTDGTLICAYRYSLNSAQNVVRVKTSADGGKTWTQRAAVTMPMNINGLALSQFIDGSVGILTRDTDDRTFRYFKVTWGTWAVSAIETAFTAVSTVQVFDMDISDGGSVGVVFQCMNGSSLMTFLRIRNTANAWTAPWNNTEYSGATRRAAGEAVSIVALNIGSGIRQWVVATGSMNTAADYGYGIWGIRITESNGTLTASAQRVTGFNAGTLSTSQAGLTKRRGKLFRVTTNEFAFVTFDVPDGATPFARIFRATLVDNVYTQTRAPGTFAGRTGSSPYINTQFGISMDANKSVVIRAVYRADPGIPQGTAILQLSIPWDPSTDTALDTSVTEWRNGTTWTADVSDGPSRNYGQGNLDGLFNYFIADPHNRQFITSVHEVVPNRADNSSAVVALTPIGGATLQLANPPLVATVDTDSQYSQSKYRIEFQFAQDPEFTTSIQTYRQPYSKGQLVSGTNGSGVTVSFNDILPSSFNLTKTTWYYRARLVEMFGRAGAWTPVQSFTVGHPPISTPVSPAGFVAYQASNLRGFSWRFDDPSPTDYQTAFEVAVYQDGVQIATTGKQVSANQYYDVAIAFGYKDVSLSWRVRTWDSDDTVGPWSNEMPFVLTDMPTATIETPTADQVLLTGVPTITFTPTTGGGRRIKEVTVIASAGPDIVWAKRIVANVNSGTQMSVKMDQGFLLNNKNYSVQIAVTDSMDAQGSSPVRTFSTAWVPPASPTGLAVVTTNYNVEDEGYISLGWLDAARDADFTSWVIYRKDDLIDPNTGVVVQAGVYKKLYTDFSIGSAYAYRDFFAPSNYQVTYQVTQMINRDGQDIESLPTASSPIVPMSDGYWLIEPTTDDLDADAFKLSIVTGDSYTPEQEEAEFTVIGRGRIVNKGQRTGRKGALDVQLRNTGGTTARQKKLRLERIQEETRQLWMRTPFGDIFRVSVSQMSISMIAGVGGNEFCDVTIPYSEVSS